MKIALLVLALALSAPASARTIRVAKDGSGDYKTLYEALDHAQSGDEVVTPEVGKFGAQIQKSGQVFEIVAVLPDSAAEKAGIKPGDKIVLIEDKEVSNMTIEEAVARMRGRAGSTLSLHIQKAGQDTARRVQVVRAQGRFSISDEVSKASIARGLGDGEAFLKLCRKAAEAGDLKAQSELAFDYYYGVAGLVSQDNKESARWAKAAAENGGGKEVLRLWGAILTDGLGVAKDPAQGSKWLRRAADQDDAWATYLLGRSYEYGLGVPRSPKDALALYKKAIEGGATPAAQDAFDKLSASQAPTAAPQAATGAFVEGNDCRIIRKKLANFPDNANLKRIARKCDEDEGVQAGAPPAPQQGLTRDDIKQMMAEAMREQGAKPEAAAKKSSDVDAPAYSKKERPDDLAVVIGIEKYASLPEASYAEHDAEAVRAHLVALGFAERNVFLLKGPQATKSAFTKELETRLSRLAKDDSTIFVYYSGHGAPDAKTGDAYLVPYDGDPEFLEDTAYPLKRLYAKLGALKAKRVIVALDSCFSGAGGRSVLAKGARPLVTKVSAAPAAGKVAALTAAAGGEISGALDEQAHGLFTYYFLKGLNDGATTLGALEKYLKPKVSDEARRHNRDQTPQLLGAGAKEAAIAP